MPGDGPTVRTRRPISALYFAVMLTGAYTAAGLFQFPREIVAEGGPEAAWSYLLECGAALFGLWLWFQVNHLYPDEQVGGFVSRIVTPFLGWPLRVLTLVTHTLLAVWVTVNFGLVMITFFLPDTPLWALETVTILVALYMAWIDTRVLGRTIQVLFVPTGVLSVLMAFLLVPRLTQMWAVPPTGDIHLGIVALAAYKGYYLFWGYEVTVTLYPFVARSARKQAERYAYTAMVLACAFFALGYVLIMGSGDPYLVMAAEWPGVSVMRLITLTSFLINKLGMFVVMLWSLFVFIFVAMRLWCLGEDIRPPLHLTSLQSYRWLLVGAAVATLAVCQLFTNVAILDAFFAEWMTPAMILFNFGVPPVLLLGAAITRKRARRSAARASSPPPSAS